MDDHPVNIAVFASGSGSNAQRIMEFFEDREDVKIKILLSNNPSAYALERAKKFNVPTYVFNREDFTKTDKVLDILKEHDVEWIILAGFLWLIPENILKAYPCRIVNIHPALLPKYGGKGMYGMKVHEAVIDANEVESGISIHFVDENYDEGEIIFQAKCIIKEGETAADLAEKIHKLEHLHFPKIIDQIIKETNL